MRTSCFTLFVWSTVLFRGEGFVPVSCSKRPLRERVIRLNNDDGSDEKEPPEFKWKKPDKTLFTLEEMDAETAQIEQESSRRVRQSLLLPYYIGKAVNLTAYFFIISAIVLNTFGYSYMIQDHWLTIDTLENRQFHDEIVRTIRKN
jgi:hypothetical protein